MSLSKIHVEALLKPRNISERVFEAQLKGKEITFSMCQAIIIAIRVQDDRIKNLEKKLMLNGIKFEKNNIDYTEV
jgi:hypothetical protein